MAFMIAVVERAVEQTSGAFMCWREGMTLEEKAEAIGRALLEGQQPFPPAMRDVALQAIELAKQRSLDIARASGRSRSVIDEMEDTLEALSDADCWDEEILQLVRDFKAADEAGALEPLDVQLHGFPSHVPAVARLDTTIPIPGLKWPDGVQEKLDQAIQTLFDDAAMRLGRVHQPRIRVAGVVMKDASSVELTVEVLPDA
jgi:hypothetical protein